MSKLRKDSYVQMTTPVGAVYGKVAGVRGRSATVTIDGRNATVSRDLLTTIRANEFHENADRSLRDVISSNEVVRGAKKEIAIRAFNRMFPKGKDPVRRDFLSAMSAYGIGRKGASTYFYKVKNGEWK